MPIPAQKIEQYIKVRRMARRGEMNERQNAQIILTRLEADHPGIASLADLVEQKQEAPTEHLPPPPRWQDWAQVIFEQVKGVVETATNVQVGVLLAEQVKLGTRQRDDGGLSVTLTLGRATRRRLNKLSGPQFAAFYEALTKRVQEVLSEKL